MCGEGRHSEQVNLPEFSVIPLNINFHSFLKLFSSVFIMFDYKFQISVRYLAQHLRCHLRHLYLILGCLDSLLAPLQCLSTTNVHPCWQQVVASSNWNSVTDVRDTEFLLCPVLALLWQAFRE